MMPNHKLLRNKLGLVSLLLAFMVSSPSQAAIVPFISPNVRDLNHHYLALSWGDIWERLSRKKSSGGSRGEDDVLVCMIAPGKLIERDSINSSGRGTIEIWDFHPLFLWQESLKGIEVRHLRSDKLMWSHQLNSSDRSIIYQGKPLQPGQVYYWRETVPPEELPPKVTFKMMKQEKRAKISAELELLENQLKAQGANKNQIIQERAKYFIEKGLWSDMFREIYSTPNPSPELVILMQQIKDHNFCPDVE